MQRLLHIFLLCIQQNQVFLRWGPIEQELWLIAIFSMFFLMHQGDYYTQVMFIAQCNYFLLVFNALSLQI